VDILSKLKSKTQLNFSYYQKLYQNRGHLTNHPMLEKLQSMQSKRWPVLQMRWLLKRKWSDSNISVSPKAGRGNRFPIYSASVAFPRVRRINIKYNTKIQLYLRHQD